MSQAPSMPMFWDAYLADTTHLTTEEHGAYLLLLAAMWRRNGSVPDDDKDNARILGLTVARWRKVKARLSSLLEIKDGEISQKNLQKIWKNTQEKIAKNRENGAKGGRPKSSKNKGIEKANGSISRNPNETIPEPEPEPYISKDTNVSLCAPIPANDLSLAVERFNAAADAADWSRVQKLNPNRSKQLRARIKDCGGVEGWEVALRKAFDSDFCRGRTAKPWHGFSFDWLLKPANFTKLMEGNYDNRSDNPRQPINGNSMVDAFGAVAAQYAAGQGAHNAGH